MVSDKQIEAAADQISEGLGAFLRKFCDSEASKRARYYLHEMPKDEWNQMALMLATEALTAAEQAEPVRWASTLPDAHKLAMEYEFRGDNGDYTPTEAERVMLEDFGNCLLSKIEPAAEPFEICPDCAGSGYSNHPDSGQVCYRCNGQGSYTHPTPFEARLKERVAELEKALEPFAREAEEWSPEANDGARAYRDKGRE